MEKIKNTIESKLGDHPQVNNDPNVKPTSGTGIGTNQGYDEGKSWVQNKVEEGQGSSSSATEAQSHLQAGSTTSPDTKGSGEASCLIGDSK